MACALSRFFPDGTAARHEAVMVVLNGTLGTIPDGRALHGAGPVPGCFQVIAVQGSAESREWFMSGTFVPFMRKGISGGFATPPTELEFVAPPLSLKAAAPGRQSRRPLNRGRAVT